MAALNTDISVEKHVALQWLYMRVVLFQVAGDSAVCSAEIIEDQKHCERNG